MVGRKQRFRNVGLGGAIKAQLTRDVLRELYIEHGQTMAGIAKRYGCTKQYVSQLCREYDIKRAER